MIQMVIQIIPFQPRSLHWRHVSVMAYQMAT